MFTLQDCPPIEYRLPKKLWDWAEVTIAQDGYRDNQYWVVSVNKYVSWSCRLAGGKYILIRSGGGYEWIFPSQFDSEKWNELLIKNSHREVCGFDSAEDAVAAVLSAWETGDDALKRYHESRSD